jgi:predicted transcriptional regulator YheO
VRDEAGKPEGCLCINFDVTDFMFVSNAFSDLTFLKNSMPGEKPDTLKEHYTQNFPETMESVIDSVIADNGRLPAMMDKAERMAVVRKLNQAGVFTIKGSVNYLAKVFGASRFTIYNYLKEIREG